MLRRLIITVLSLAAALLLRAFLMAAAPHSWLAEALLSALFGCYDFALRTWPRVTVRSDGMAVFLAAMLAAVAVAHQFLRWWRRQRTPPTSPAGTAWRLKWTVVAMGLGLLVFAAGVAMVGVLHQAAWLGTSPTPLLSRELHNPGYPRGYPIRKVGMDMHGFVSAHGLQPRLAGNDAASQHGWIVLALPYLWHQIPEIDESRPWDDPANAAAYRKLVPNLLNPHLRGAPLRDARGYGLNHFAANERVLRPTRGEISQLGELPSPPLLLMGEVNDAFEPWGHPDNCRDPLAAFGSADGFGGPADSEATLFSLTDGSVRELSHKIDPLVLRAMSEP